jgi:hypothetical protein
MRFSRFDPPGFLVQTRGKIQDREKTTHGVVAARLQDGCISKPADSANRGPAHAGSIFIYCNAMITRMLQRSANTEIIYFNEGTRLHPQDRFND